MRILKIVVMALLAVLAVALLVGSFLPSQWSVERSLAIQAPPAAIHPLVANLRHWPRWMPWMEDDPSMPIEFEGPDGAAGSRMSRKSGKNGNGTLTVTSSSVEAGVEYALRMEESAEPARGSIAFRREGGATLVTWKDGGSLGKNPIGRLFRPVLESMLSGYFDRGLANLKRIAEGGG